MRLPRGLAPTSTLVASVAALALVSGGSAVAGSLITSAQIKDGTIQVKDLKKSTVKALKGKKGSRGPAGEQGPQGEQGEPGTARGWALVQPDGALVSTSGTFENLVITHLDTGVYCLGDAPGTNNGLFNYDPVVATAHGQDFAKLVVTINTEYGSECNPYGGHGAFVTDLEGTPADAYFVLALL